MRDLLTGRAGCAAPGSLSSSNPLRALADAVLGSSSKSEQINELSGSSVCPKSSFDSLMADPLSTIPGSESEIKLDQLHREGTDLIKWLRGDASGEKIQSSNLSVPELRMIEPHIGESEQTDNANGPPEMDDPPLVPRSSFLPYNLSDDLSGLCLEPKDKELLDHTDALYDTEMRTTQTIMNSKMDEYWILELHELEQGIDRRPMSEDELSGEWLSFLQIALSHLGGLSQPKFWEEKNKFRGRVIQHRVWIELEGLQQRSGWSVKLKATRKSLFDALQDAAMLAVITMRLHFPREFRDTPFIVLPMVPGQRSRLDYPAVGGSAVAATSMGVDYKDVERLQRERFTSFYRERQEPCDALRQHNLKLQQLSADYSNLAEEFIFCPTGTPEMWRRKAELSKRFDEMWEIPDIIHMPVDCGWSVFVPDKVLQQRGTEDEALGGWDAAGGVSNCNFDQVQALSEMHRFLLINNNRYSTTNLCLL